MQIRTPALVAGMFYWDAKNEFTHQQAKSLIEPILKLDVGKFYTLLEDRNMHACGYGADVSTMIACKETDATKRELFKYATSGDITRNTGSAVYMDQ
jgi:MEMO1 family protein